MFQTITVTFITWYIHSTHTSYICNYYAFSCLCVCVRAYIVCNYVWSYQRCCERWVCQASQTIIQFLWILLDRPATICRIHNSQLLSFVVTSQLHSPFVQRLEQAHYTRNVRMRTYLFTRISTPSITYCSYMRCRFQRIKCGAFGRALHSFAASHIQPATSEDALEKGCTERGCSQKAPSMGPVWPDISYYIILTHTHANIVYIYIFMYKHSIHIWYILYLTGVISILVVHSIPRGHPWIGALRGGVQGGKAWKDQSFRCLTSSINGVCSSQFRGWAPPSLVIRCIFQAWIHQGAREVWRDAYEGQGGARLGRPYVVDMWWIWLRLQHFESEASVYNVRLPPTIYLSLCIHVTMCINV